MSLFFLYRLFDDAATKLNLKSLMGFMSELSFCSHKQLLTIFPKRAPSTKLGKKQKHSHSSVSSSSLVHTASSAKATQATCSTLLFHRISEVMLKCVRGGRPLLHIVKAWAVVGPHLMEVRNLNGTHSRSSLTVSHWQADVVILLLRPLATKKT